MPEEKLNRSSGTRNAKMPLAKPSKHPIRAFGCVSKSKISMLLTPYITGSKKLRIKERGAKLFAVRVNAFVSLIS